MKIFLDTAIVEDIARRNDGLISGVTTNPTLIAKSGRVPDEVYEEIFDQGIKDLSIEVRGEYFDELIANALMTNQMYGNKATIKLPCTVDGLQACKYLTSRHIRVNMTLVFSVSQAILCSIAGATYVSPFIGRLDDNGHDGLGLIREISKIYCYQASDTEILAASIRDPKTVSAAFAAGAHICTIPPKVFDGMFKHVLTDKGLFQFKQDFDANL
jgi:transaldolase|tara:strand:+ start:448 stop:1089 length:642 start_codon:yes stop_codon:yes gene_type:complete